LVTYSNNLEGLWSLARHKIKDFSLENRRFAVGVSGGADSIGLFHVFCDFFKKNIISDLVIFHINYGLRGAESDGDERFVRAQCETQSVPFLLHNPPQPITTSVQETARNVRLDLQAQLNKQGFLVALAHNADDISETVLMRLCRGTAPQQAAGMTYFNGQIFRPWLDISKETIRNALSAAHLGWREDSSNTSGLYTRNRIRNEVMPILNELFPGASGRLSKSFLRDFVEPSGSLPSSIAKLPLSFFEESARRDMDAALHRWFTAQYGGRSPVARQVIEKISQALLGHFSGSREVKEFHLPEGRILKLTGAELTLSQRN
jgi:tRNA(Ile)-lysidine synthetase-like protein